MYLSKKEIQLQYQGFLATPFLWEDNTAFGLEQFKLSTTKTTAFTEFNEKKLRLGKWIERFVVHQLQHEKDVQILAENIQILENKLTLGELDCLFIQGNTPVHLEISYKFYLYDATVGQTPLAHWIGPNRRDALVQKLTKLKEKQLPLLYHPSTQKVLESLKINVEDILQRIYVKAQLFIPIDTPKTSFPFVNNDCIVGYYVYPEQLQRFEGSKFYIPTKHQWLIQPHPQVDWLHYADFTKQLQTYLTQQNAPLCWVKQPNGTLLKVFVVWW